MQTHNNIHVRENYSNTISWPAIFGGVVVAITIGLLLNLIGTALGFAAFSPTAEKMKTLSMATLVWMFVTGIVSMFAGGWIGSFLSGFTDMAKGYWQGFIVASLTILLMLYLATSAAGSLISGSFSAIGSIAQASGSAIAGGASGASKAASAMSNVSKDDVVDKAKNMLPESMQPLVDQINYEADSVSDSIGNEVANQAPSADDVKNKVNNAKDKAAAYKKKVSPALHNFLQSINTDNYEQAHKDLVEAISQASGKSNADVEAKVTEWKNSYEAAKAKAAKAAEEAAEQTAEFVSHFAFVSFFLMLAGLLSAGLGGYLAARAKYND